MLTALEGIAEREAERERMAWVRMAWFAAILLSPYTNGRPIDFNELLPEQFQLEKPEGRMSREDALRTLRGIKERLGISDGN